MNADPCRLVRPYFSDQLDGEPLPPVVGFFVRFHIRVCPPCRRTYQSLAATRDALRALRDDDGAELDAKK
jgi:predicted anti-sigma-YlaC factor YlaD